MGKYERTNERAARNEHMPVTRVPVYARYVGRHTHCAVAQ